MHDRVTFIHAADLHLDAPFVGLTAASERIGRALAEATYDAFRRVIDTALEREVDFVLVAGDAYNARDKSLRAQLRFREQMKRLAEEGIEVFVVHGNHDPASGWSAGLALPDNVHCVPDRPCRSHRGGARRRTGRCRLRPQFRARRRDRQLLPRLSA